MQTEFLHWILERKGPYQVRGKFLLLNFYKFSTFIQTVHSRYSTQFLGIKPMTQGYCCALPVELQEKDFWMKLNQTAFLPTSNTIWPALHWAIAPFVRNISPDLQEKAFPWIRQTARSGKLRTPAGPTVSEPCVTMTMRTHISPSLSIHYGGQYYQYSMVYWEYEIRVPAS